MRKASISYTKDMMLPWILLAMLIIYVVWVFLPWNLGAPFDPSSTLRTHQMIGLLDIVPGDKVADLGSGDGRVVIAMVGMGAEAHGYEINPFLVLYARWNVRRAGVQDTAFIHWKSFWRADFSDYKAVTVFQYRHVMARLEARLLKELPPEAMVISHHWRFPTWQPSHVSGDVLRYDK